MPLDKYYDPSKLAINIFYQLILASRIQTNLIFSPNTNIDKAIKSESTKEIKASAHLS